MGKGGIIAAVLFLLVAMGAAYKAMQYRSQAQLRAQDVEKIAVKWNKERLETNNQNSRFLASLSVNLDAVLLGASITQLWDLPQAFPGKAYLNRGIGAEHTADMQKRLQEDVLNLKPKVLVIMGGGGINDILNSPPGEEVIRKIVANTKAMAEQASSAGLQVVISSIIPVNRDVGEEYYRPGDQVKKANDALAGLVKEVKNIHYVDIASAMADSSGDLKKEFSNDGLHPNTAGYEAMKGALGPELEKVLRSLTPPPPPPAQAPVEAPPAVP